MGYKEAGWHSDGRAGGTYVQQYSVEETLASKSEHSFIG